MVEHFAAFSFVDRIIEFEPGRRARALYFVPPGISGFPSCLVAEAVGQLAAWIAMTQVGFRARPVAALASETRFGVKVAPGDTLELEVEIQSCDEEAVAYSGRARVGASVMVELVDCLGPMRAVDEFDSPAELAARFDVIRGAGAAPGAFRGVVAPRVVRNAATPVPSESARLHVPKSAPFFGDHFPRRPVFPATLLLDAEIGFALDVANEANLWPGGARPTPSRMTHVKMRSFIPPGATLEIAAALAPLNGASATIRLSARMDGKIVATERLDVVAEEVA